MTLSHPFQAVIFDLDGVLTATEPVIFDILKGLVREHGVELTPEDYQALLGLDYANTAAYLIERYSIPLAPKELEALFQEAVLEQIGPKLALAPGARALVGALESDGTALGLASNSPCEYVRTVLQALDLGRYFPAPVCREDVLNGKPAPEPYEQACWRAAALPLRCLAIEDSLTGAQSALAAGLTCILIGGEGIDPLPPGVRAFANLDEVLKGFEEGMFA